MRCRREARVELLPASPTFLNLLLLSEAHKTLRSEQPEGDHLRHRADAGEHAAPPARGVPRVRLQQTYGLIEVGVLRSKSRSSDSLWVKIGGEGYETRVVDGILQIRADSAMLGYLNAPSPFTEDGWFITGDAVELDGE